MTNRIMLNKNEQARRFTIILQNEGQELASWSLPLPVRKGWLRKRILIHEGEITSVVKKNGNATELLDKMQRIFERLAFETSLPVVHRPIIMNERARKLFTKQGYKPLITSLAFPFQHQKTFHGREVELAQDETEVLKAMKEALVPKAT